MVQLGQGVHGGTNFAQVERDHVRARLYPAFDWVAFDAFSPLNSLRVPLAEARVAFVTTCGAHLPEQEPFDIAAAAGDPSYRTFCSTTPLANLALSHSGYDTRRASADKNVVLPLDHLRAVAAEGRIGEVGPTIYSFMGYVADSVPLLTETGPAVAARLLADAADLVLLAPT